MRFHDKSVFMKVNTGDTRPYPTGHESLVAADVQKLRLAGYTEVVEVVETKTGHRLPIIIENQGGGPAKINRKLGSRRPDGHLAYLLVDQWERLPAKQKEVLLGKAKNMPTVDVAAEEQEAIVSEIESVQQKKAKS